MITASEPLEFVPRGRKAVDNHPGPAYDASARSDLNAPLTDNFLLHRLGNISLSPSDPTTEFWHIKERFENVSPHKPASRNASYQRPVYENTEDELYVRGHTAVWSSGLALNGDSVHFQCFTLESPIKFAFFCPENFIKMDPKYRSFDRKNEQKSSFCLPVDEHATLTGISLVDCSLMKTYLSNGEDFLASLEFPVAAIWPMWTCMLFEREASVSTVDVGRAIPMPRVFSLKHPLDEMCPVLLKYDDDLVGYFSAGDFRLIFSDPQYNLLLVYDQKAGRHFVCRLHRATEEEVNYVIDVEVAASAAEANTEFMRDMSSQHFLPTTSMYANTRHNLSRMMHTTMGNRSMAPTATCSPHVSHHHQHHRTRLLSANVSKSLQSPVTRLQSTIRHTSFSMQDARNLGQAEPSKPIVPEFCLHSIWLEEAAAATGMRHDRALNEPASRAFFHTSCVGDKYLCFYVGRQAQLTLIPLTAEDGGQLGPAQRIQVKEPVSLNKLNLIVGLDQSCTLVLYTGTTFVAKVHIGGVLSHLATSETFGAGSFPKRSSLLPTAPSDSEFDHHDLHLLSPVAPMPAYQKSMLMTQSSGYCLGLRDPAGNRVTLQCKNQKMYRIALPAMCDSALVTRCLAVMRTVVRKREATTLIVKWYGLRNAPGAKDLSPVQEWRLFERVLFELMGRPVSGDSADDSKTGSNDGGVGGRGSTGSGVHCDEPKRRKRDESNDCGSDADWEFLLAMKNGGRVFRQDEAPPIGYISTSCLFERIPAVFRALHLLYEDLKLDLNYADGLELIGETLYRLATDLGWARHREHYFLDHPRLGATRQPCRMSKENWVKLQSIEDVVVPNIFRTIERMASAGGVVEYPYLSQVNLFSCRVLKALQKHKRPITKLVLTTSSKGEPMDMDEADEREKGRTKDKTAADKKRTKNQVNQRVIFPGITSDMIKCLPYGVKALLVMVLYDMKISPPPGLSESSYNLIMRPDLAAHAKYDHVDYTHEELVGAETSLSARVPQQAATTTGSTEANDVDDGMLNMDTKLLRLRFRKDLRIMEVRRLLDSTTPVPIDIVQGPNVSDHEFIEDKEKQLFALCTRTMALPTGRGMFTLRSSIPVSVDAMTVPKLCLTGKEVTKGATVELVQMEVAPEWNLWPLFHNGVAAGLKVSPDQKDVDSTWIVYNKPQQDLTAEHSGFLMALGLNGHLRSLSFMSIYDYLVRCDEMTSVGLLLGIAAAHCGTQDAAMTKVLSVHVEALLPPTALELDIQQNVQIASVMGIGLVYQGTANRHIAEVLLQEIGRPPGPEMENCTDRESYSLTAGLALGMVTLGLGATPTALQDLELADTLHHYIMGGAKRPIRGAQKEKYKLPSFQIREGDNVNVDVTAPGATLGLGLMYLRTNNRAVAKWMEPPATQYDLKSVRPDLLLLRIIAKGLIMWDDIQPTKAWLEGQIPTLLRFDLKRGPPVDDEYQAIDDEAYCQAYCNIIAGAAFTVGLKYAGTEDATAYQTLKAVFDLFMAMPGQYIGEYAGKTCVEGCLVMALLSLALVFAGSGNLDVMRLVRALRARIGTQNVHVTYGSHMALHMALGLLFMGAGRYTLSRSPKAIAALVCALFPKFPIHSNDNRYHLQAFRHLYVLAVDARLFLPRDIDTGRLAMLQLSCVKLDATTEEEDALVKLPTAPCILPELDSLRKVVVTDPNYYTVEFERGTNWDQLKRILAGSQCVAVKKRAGRLSLLEDPTRLKSLLAKTYTAQQNQTWHIKTKTLTTLGKDEFVATFVNIFLAESSLYPDKSRPEAQLKLEQLYRSHFYCCLLLDCVEAFPVFVAYIDGTRRMLNQDCRQTNAIDVWQHRLMCTLVDGGDKGRQVSASYSDELVEELALQLRRHLDGLLLLAVGENSQQQQLRQRVQQYTQSATPAHWNSVLGTFSRDQLHQVAALVTYFDLIPFGGFAKMPSNPLQLLMMQQQQQQQRQMAPLTVSALLKLRTTTTTGHQ